MEPEERHSLENWVARAWANELGGRLIAALNDELYGSKKPTSLEPMLHKASEEKFIAHGKTKAEHRAWRLRELKELRIFYLKVLTWKINTEHPAFTTNYNEITEVLECGIPPLTEPEISLEDLDSDITDWYLETERETSFSIPGRTASDRRDLPKSIAYMKWQLSMEDAKPNAIQEQLAQEVISLTTHLSQASTNWRFLNEDDVEGEELDEKQVSEQVHRWMLHAAKGGQAKGIDEIIPAVKSAQNEATKESKRYGNRIPVRLRKSSGYYLDQFALVMSAGKGRPPKGGGGSKYKLIKASVLGSEAHRPVLDLPSDEPPQELNHSANEATNQD